MYLFRTPVYIYLIIVANTLALFILGWWVVWGKARERSTRLGGYLLILGGVIYSFCAILTYQGAWLGYCLLLLVEKIISYRLRQREEQMSSSAVFGSKELSSPERRRYLLHQAAATWVWTGLLPFSNLNPVLWSEVRLLLAQIGVYFVMRLVWVSP